jgi:hypothetical protein
MASADHDLDLKAGITLAQDVVDAYHRRLGVFEDTSDLLEYQRPDGVRSKSREHANFLFYLISQDHGVKSYRLYARAKALYAKDPDLFDPERILAKYGEAPAERIVEATARQLGTRYPNETGRQWLQNSRALIDLYGADSRNIFFQSDDSLEALRRVKDFRGFGPKTSALLFRTFHGIGLINLPRTNEIPIPVDIHDTRIAFVSGLLKLRSAPESITSDNYMTYAEMAQKAWMRVCEAAHLDWLALDRALWLLGSRGCDPYRYVECCLRKNCTRRGGAYGEQGSLGLS